MSRDNVKLLILNPGHFHAALLQKTMVPNVDATVHVYAPPGPDAVDYLKKIEAYNARAENPTHWVTQLYTGADYLERCVAERAGNVAVMSGNNRLKTHYITELLKAGINVLADKPMAIDSANFAELEKAFVLAQQKGLLLYDIMTERFEITTVLQKEFSAITAVFGDLQQGDAAHPAVVKESVHHFFKYISGTPIKRPAWFFDTAQYGEGLVDITTHLVDLVQWECFPGQKLDYRSDVQVQGARRWPTVMTPAQFEKVTQLKSVPDYLQKDVRDGNLEVYANGEINYRLKGIHAKVVVLWNFEAPEGSGDTHYSVMRGSKAELVIRQGKEQNYQPVLTIEPLPGVESPAYDAELDKALATLQKSYPGIDLKPVDKGWEVTIPARYHVGHEAHFGQVAEQFLSYLAKGALPEWEQPDMIAKYFTTTSALRLARNAA
jgi:predicted dehydrogenase